MLAMTKRRICLLVILILAFCYISTAMGAEQPLNEKDSILKSKFFGDLSKAKKIKKSSKTVLQVWEPFKTYTQSITDNSLKNTMLKHVNELNIEYHCCPVDDT